MATPDPARPSARFLVLTFVGFLVAVGLSIPFRPRWSTLTEVTIWAGLVVVIRCGLPWARMPRPHRRVLAGLLAASILGQLVGASRLTFPFSQWNMYAVSTDRTEVPLDRIGGVDADGQPVDLTYSELWPTIGWRAEYALSRAFRRTVGGEPAPRWDRVDAILRAVGAAYNRRHPDAPLAAVVLRRVTIPVAGAPADEAGRVVRTVALEGA